MLDNTCKKFDSIINCCFGCFFFWYSNWILAYFCYPTDTYRFFLPLSLPIKHRSMFSVGSCLAASLWAETKTTKKKAASQKHMCRPGWVSKVNLEEAILPWYLRVNRQMSTNNNLEKETRSRVAHYPICTEGGEYWNLLLQDEASW